jgi:competence transcription factor ComK
MPDGICFLKESGTEKDIAVNAHHVRLVKEIDTARVAVVFDNDLQITVDGTVASISDALRKSKW